MRIKKGKDLSCPICQTKFYVKPHEISRRKYCSLTCRNIGYVGRTLSKEQRLKMSQALKGRIFGYKFTKGSLIAKELGRKTGLSKKGKRLTESHRINLSLGHTKEKQFNGFKREIRGRIMRMREYLEWRATVFKRDNYHCQNCGEKGYIEAHHIIPFKVIIEEFGIKTIDQAIECRELWDVGNGITYCRKCHILLDKNIGRRSIPN